VLIVVIAPAHALVVMMLLTVSHGLLFNNSHLTAMVAGLFPTGHAPAHKICP
jgi:hypothetical protein